MKFQLLVALAYIKSIPARIRAHTINFIRNSLLINADFQTVAGELSTVRNEVFNLTKESFAMFNAAPFFAAILTLDAASATKMTNTNAVQRNSLISVLTSICLAMRAGEPSLQLFGELPESVYVELVRRKFRIEVVSGSNNNSGIFILWT